MFKCEKIYKYIKISILLIIILLVCQGCIVFNPKYAEKDKEGYYVYHYSACGPLALEKALRAFGEDVNRKQLSREIQTTGNASRKAVALIHYEGIQITWPSEIKTILNRYGYDIQKLDNFSELKAGDVGIVLLLGDTMNFQYHWVSFPEDKKIETHFGKNTKIIKVYKLVPPK